MRFYGIAALGLTRVSFWQCALASLTGMLPGGLMYVCVGSAARFEYDSEYGKDRRPFLPGHRFIPPCVRNAFGFQENKGSLGNS